MSTRPTNPLVDPDVLAELQIMEHQRGLYFSGSFDLDLSLVSIKRNPNRNEVSPQNLACNIRSNVVFFLKKKVPLFQNEDDVHDFDEGEEDVEVEEEEEGVEQTDGGDEVQEEEEVGDDEPQKVNLQSIKHKVRLNFFPKKKLTTVLFSQVNFVAFVVDSVNHETLIFPTDRQGSGETQDAGEDEETEERQ